MAASDQLVRIGQGRKLHLLASYLLRQPDEGPGRIHGRAACGAKGTVTTRRGLDIDVLEALDPCPRCTEVAATCADWLADHRRIFPDPEEGR